MLPKGNKDWHEANLLSTRNGSGSAVERNNVNYSVPQLSATYKKFD